MMNLGTSLKTDSHESHAGPKIKNKHTLPQHVIYIQDSNSEIISWLVVSTHLKNINQNGNLPQNRGEHKNKLKPPPRSAYHQHVMSKLVEERLIALEVNHPAENGKLPVG